MPSKKPASPKPKAKPTKPLARPLELVRQPKPGKATFE